MSKKNNQQVKIIKKAFEVEEKSAKEAGTIGYMAKVWFKLTIPHKKVNGNEFKPAVPAEL